MKEARYTSILDIFSWDKSKISVLDIFRLLKIKKINMIASYEQDGSGVEQAKHLIDELEKLQYLWCLVEQNSSLSLDQFKHNLKYSAVPYWVLNRQEVDSLSCELNALIMPNITIGHRRLSFILKLIVPNYHLCQIDYYLF